MRTLKSRDQAQTTMTLTRRVGPVLIKDQTKVATTVIVTKGPTMMRVAQIRAAVTLIRAVVIQIMSHPRVNLQRSHQRKRNNLNSFTRLRPSKVR
jgi:hypothetical protein